MPSFSDGYKSLLAKSEGGSVEEIVDAESGILISMMLRQYFMALKVLDRWSNWNENMEQCWGNVVSSIDHRHPHLPPSASALPSPGHGDSGRAGGAARRSAAELRQWWSSVAPFDERVVDGASRQQHADEVQRIDRQLQVMRRIARKWCRLAGVHSHQCDTLTEDECHAKWTKAIAPGIEGRIRIVGGGEASQP